MYTFGQGAFGALGHGSKDDIDSPKLVETLWGLGIVQVTISLGILWNFLVPI